MVDLGFIYMMFLKDYLQYEKQKKEGKSENQKSREAEKLEKQKSGEAEKQRSRETEIKKQMPKMVNSTIFASRLWQMLPLGCVLAAGSFTTWKTVGKLGKVKD